MIKLEIKYYNSTRDFLLKLVLIIMVIYYFTEGVGLSSTKIFNYTTFNKDK